MKKFLCTVCKFVDNDLDSNPCSSCYPSHFESSNHETVYRIRNRKLCDGCVYFNKEYKPFEKSPCQSCETIYGIPTNYENTTEYLNRTAYKEGKAPERCIDCEHFGTNNVVCSTCMTRGGLRSNYKEKEMEIYAEGSDGVFATEIITYDPIKNPAHYTADRKYEPRKVIYDWGLNFNLGNAVKYIARAGRKGYAIDDLRKAIQYLEFELEEIDNDG